MVLVNHAGQEKVIVVKPNHSATWRHNLWLLAALAVPSLGAGIACAPGRLAVTVGGPW